MRWWKKRLCTRGRLNGLAIGNSICEGDKVNRLMKWWPPILWPQPPTSCFQDLTWPILKISIRLTKSCQLLWNQVKTPYWCSVITIIVLQKSPHYIIISHSPSSHKNTISNHPDSLKSCAMAQIWTLHDNSFVSTISLSSQANLSSRSIYHHVKLISGQTISDTT